MLDHGDLEILAAGGALLGLVGLAVAATALALAMRVRRAAVPAGPAPAGDPTLMDAAAVRRELERVIRNVALVRYDAFPDAGGRLSFSAALLDDTGGGLVLTAINGRSETRAYAKLVVAGESQQTLSPEERQAIEEAMDRQLIPRR